jgi:transposase-like protein
MFFQFIQKRRICQTSSFFSKQGWRYHRYQNYRCRNCDRQWHQDNLIGMFTIEMIEYFAYVYLRSLSLNNTIEIIQAWFEKISEY